MNSEIRLRSCGPIFLRYGDIIINRERIESVCFNETYGAQIRMTGSSENKFFSVPNKVANAWFSDIVDLKRTMEAK